MGIQGLLPLLKSIMSPVHVEELRGATVAVDTYSWLHKGALACSPDLCKKLPTTKHIDYCMHRVNLLRHFGIKPILIFDGGFLPMKVDQETKRARIRKENLERAVEHEANGNSRGAFECYQKAVDISPLIASQLIQVLKQENVDYIVAPYEADAQMTYLSINNFVNAVITEDSDLIPFGCSRIIFKMDKFGQAVEFRSSLLHKNKELDFSGFTKRMILEMCIFSGCDYLQSLPGMGLKRAHALVQKLKSYEKIIKHLRYCAVSIPPLYEDSFKKAIWAFQHQRVYDPVKEDIVHLTDMQEDFGNDLDFLGPWLPQDVVTGIAKGHLDPFTKKPFQDNQVSVVTIERKEYLGKHAPTNGRKRLDLPVQKNALTNYFCLASLEAKRKFRAPKVMSKNLAAVESPSPSFDDNSSDTQCSPDNATTCTANSSQESPLHSEKTGQESPSVDMIEDQFTNADTKLVSHAYPPTNSSVFRNPCSSPDANDKILKPTLASYRNGTGNRGEKSEITSKSMYVTTMGKSPYFANEVLDDSYPDKKNGQSVVDRGEVSVLKEAPHRNGFHKCPIKKRKLSNVESLENVRIKSLPGEGDDSSNITNPVGTTKSEGSFTCNMSHLKNYNKIAEKSMERFASLMSSFRYTGSRVSGLRPPLKDVQNTCTARNAS